MVHHDLKIYLYISIVKNIPNHLRQAFLDKKLIPLVGAGVSMSLSDHADNRIFPNWAQLLENAATELEAQCKSSYATGIKAMIALNKYLDAADIAKEGLTGGLWNIFLKKTFDIDRSRIKDSSLTLPATIWSLSNRIITLNFDRVLEFACPTVDVRTIENKNRAELADFSRSAFTKKAVWHLHGSINDIDSTIFTGASYESLYGDETEYQAALAVLGELCKSETLLFIGCSLEDADLLRRINKVTQIFGGNCGPHYALVRSTDAYSIQEKLKGLPIQVITFDEFGQPLLDSLNAISQIDEPKLGIPDLNIDELRLKANSSEIKIAVLFSQPLDYHIDYGELFREIAKLKCAKDYKNLTISNLNSLDGYDYIFILSTLLKGKLSIENQWLSNERIDASELIDNIGQNYAKGVFIILSDGFPYKDKLISNISTNLPIAIYENFDRRILPSVFFKLFRKKIVKLTQHCEIINEPSFDLSELTGINYELKKKSSLADSIDPKIIHSFTGRTTDLQNIAKMIFELQRRDEILTLKGTGGIGKTATIKKLAVEMSKRNIFPDGISFIDCEFIESHKVLEHNILQIFNLDEASDLRIQLQENLIRQEKLVILDNVETLLYLPDKEPILETLSFLSDYVTLVVTSRELLGLPNEKPYELKRLSTDEALMLFLQNIPDKNTSLEEKKIIREQILENLLDNSPLAIKLITKNIPSTKDFSTLAKELENNLFSKVTEQDILAFDQPTDFNVEKKRSLYASINYSYSKLNDKEKLSFELLSLFPDGVDIESFKRLINQGLEHNERLKYLGNPAINFIITDPIIRNLENKSLVETNNKLVRLQSIIGRFSEQKFQQRDTTEIQRLYNNCFHFNKASANVLAQTNYQDRIGALSTFNKFQKNFLKCVSYLPLVSAQPTDICSYLFDLVHLVVNSCTSRLLINALDKAGDFFPDQRLETLFVKVAKIYCRYYDGDFSTAISELRNILPEEELFKLAPENWLERAIAALASDIYGLEGSTLDNVALDARYLIDYNRYPDSLFRVGDFDQNLLFKLDPHFFNFEAQLALGILQVSALDKYIDRINERQRIELMQVNYTRTKLTGFPRINVDLLLVVNPYTAGIKLLIKALTSSDTEKKSTNFTLALPYLKHIKYYYTEALLLYSEHLKDYDRKKFEKIRYEGLTLAKTYHFQYLIYRFEKIENPQKEEYNFKNYPLPDNRPYDSMIRTIKSKH